MVHRLASRIPSLLLLLLAACSPSAVTRSASSAAQPSTEIISTPAATSEFVSPKTRDESNGEKETAPLTPPATSPLVIDLAALPPVDTSLHSVPLEEVFFDTFRRVDRAVPLSRAEPDLIESLLDAIPPLYNPKFETVADADRWLADEDLVLGYASEGQAYAYPINILNYHEIVRHEVSGRPILATYCPLCRSGIVYDSRIKGEPLLFGNTSALFESDMVMVDHQTGSYWMQVSGEAIVGKLTGEKLQALPSQTTTWELWKQQYPNTYSLSRNTGYNRNYALDPFATMGEQLNDSGRFVFPVSKAGRDARLDPGEVVLGVTVADISRAYPLDRIGDGVINETVGETALTIFSQSTGPTGAAYSRMLADRLLTFALVDGIIQDEETGSQWNLAGEAVAGELKGARLEPLPSRSTFWFSLIAAFPDLELHSIED